MRLHRFYINNLALDEKITLNGKDYSDTVHQIANVFRAKIGDDFIFFNCLDSYDYVYTLVNIDKKELQFVLKDKIEKKTNKERGVKITLCQSIIKKDNFELVVRQMVEAGVSSVIPILTDRSEKKVLNIERLEKIIVEATEQSGRNDIMKLEKTLKIEDILSRAGEKIVFDTIENSDVVKESTKSSDLYVLIGPEGGWTDEEKKVFVQNDFRFETLPTYTLRAETAAISAVIYMLK
jgi:16S rRNA (uracil1498-N3)-methyltransferase